METLEKFWKRKLLELITLGYYERFGFEDVDDVFSSKKRTSKKMGIDEQKS